LINIESIDEEEPVGGDCENLCQEHLATGGKEPHPPTPGFGVVPRERVGGRE